ncbi:Cell cycle checkpoint protein RAD17 [Apostasia shenzhenica]|uniref:Cell cycle checkpoint protein RAD17 n=1 Tax=Apostasia shenzhenica TaxID=1088818 RepID=A0A2I0AEP6_9ASPA|nr:Cell cycle checkpoint protein RAD17 [Apostasia shenzhenica]
MGKRKTAVVCSTSPEEDAGRKQGSRSSSSKSFAAARKRTRGGSSQCGVGEISDKPPSRGAEAFARLSEDYCECLQDFPSTQGMQCSKGNELWVDKYKPSSPAQLAVHKKKVEEVKNWLRERLIASKEKFGNHVLLITGQAGVGKSAAVRVLAAHMGAELCEYSTPTPTLWHEHVHNINSGLSYRSKLDEFEAFVEKIGKYSLLSSSNAGASRKATIILIDDLPVTNGRVAFGRLKKCLTALTRFAQLPTVILVTEYHRTDNVPTSHFEELVSLLERAGAYKVAFNRLTVNSIKKVLSHICQEEKRELPSIQIDQIAKASCGDMRNAINSLQFWCLSPDNLLISYVSNSMDINSRVLSDSNKLSPIVGLFGHEELNCGTDFSYGRDETLTLFHALGKFLHNKREVMDQIGLELESLTLREKFERNPLKMDAPEKVLSQAYGKARPVTDFLHENVLDFISDGAIDDTWLVTSYLSDADCLLASSLLSHSSQKLTEMDDSQRVSQPVAASVAIRGVLFGNKQPLSSRWHAIRSPRLWQIEQSAQHHKNKLMVERFYFSNGFSLSLSQMVTDYMPSIKWLGSHTTDDNGHEKLIQCITTDLIPPADNFSSNTIESTFREKIEDDEIEDW